MSEFWKGFIGVFHEERPFPDLKIIGEMCGWMVEAVGVGLLVMLVLILSYIAWR